MKFLRRILIAAAASLFALCMGTTVAQASAPDWLNIDPNETLIVMGGTDDPHAQDQMSRVAHWVQPHNIQTVDYAASFGPVIGNQPYDASVEDGKQRLRELLATQPAGKRVTVVSISQGGRIVGDLAREFDVPEYAGRVRFIGMSDPRDSLRGLEARFAGMGLPGATATGSRPATQHVEYTSVCIEGDPICADVVDPAAAAFGFYCTHAGGCGGIDYHYGNLHHLEVRSLRTEGATTYVMMKAPTPTGQIAETFTPATGLHY